jgi:hypothetical protein
VRAQIEAFPQIPALKSIMAHLTKEKEWCNLRPPLVDLEGWQERKLLDGLPLSELL